jgi:hypothetical protein
MKSLLRLAAMLLCLVSFNALATDTADVSVQVTETEVIVTWTGNIDYQGGACCMYFRCYSDSTLVHSREGIGSYSYQYTYPKGFFSQGNHTFRTEVLLPFNPDVFDSETISIDNTPQMAANGVENTTQPFDITGTATFVDNGVNTEGTLYIQGYNPSPFKVVF